MSDEKNGRAGLLYGWNHPPLFYYLILVAPDDSVEIYRRDPEGVNKIRSTSILPGDNFVKLRVVEKGQEVTVYANGDSVDTFQSQQTGVGSIGIAAMGIGRFGFNSYKERSAEAKTEGKADADEPAAVPARNNTIN